MSDASRPIIVVKKKRRGGHGHHGGAWKVAFADFVTAMMAFFLVMWLVATVPQEQLAGISEYLRNPSAAEGKAAVMVAGADGLGGAGASTEGAKELATPEPPPPASAPLDEDAARRIQEEAERRRLDDLRELLTEAIASSRALAPFKDQLLIDLTPEGLRIQIVDALNRPMFDSGASQLKDYSRAILRELAPLLDQVDNRIALSGHTDAKPFVTANGYGNWELSADRANAARRALVAGGLPEAKVARVVGLASSVPLDRADPESASNRRINIVVLNRAAEEAAARTERTLDDAPPAAAEPPPAGG